MEIKVLYEDEYILALDKPSGLLVHSDGRSKEATLVDWINEHYPDLKEVGEPQILQSGEVIKRPGIVHRLDRDTSGVILVAKTQEAHKFLKEQFQNRKVEKIYNTVVWGSFGKERLNGVIDEPIGRSVSGRWSTSSVKNKTREAMTEYKVLFQTKFENDGHTKIRRSSENSGGKKFAYLEVKPKTGRTHQIRVHMKSISHPVIMDKLYGNKDSFLESGILGFNRLALHALSIKLELPNQSHITIESPLPKEFESAKNLLK